MPMNWQTVEGVFNDELYTFIGAIEAPVVENRLALHEVNGNPTIGIGFDLKAGGTTVQNAVLIGLGFHRSIEDEPASDNANNLAAMNIERGYRQRLVALMDARNTSVNDYNRIMVNRRNNLDANYATLVPVNQRRSTFCFDNEDEVKNVFLSLWESVYRRRVITRIEGAEETDNAFTQSKEMMVLASLVWNNASLIGENLSAAIADGQRATAWYEIRYNSNSTRQNAGIRSGVAKRRFMESQVFGLYDDPQNVTASEAQAIFQMLQSCRERIMEYEDDFGHNPDSSNASNNRIEAANTDYSTILRFTQNISGAEVSELAEALLPAQTALLAALDNNMYVDKNSFTESWFGGGTLIPTNIYIAPEGSLSATLDSSDAQKNDFFSGVSDLLIGDDESENLNSYDGDDVLFGGAGNDLLDGGAGRDYLHGGRGYNTYFVDENDVIVIDDEYCVNGQVFLNRNQLSQAFRGEFDRENLFDDYHGNYFSYVGNDLVINGKLKIMNFKIYAHSMTLGVCYGLTALGISVLTGREECQLPKQELRSTRTRVDPLSIDLSGNEKIDTTEVNDKKTPVWFDHNKDGLKEQTGWITNGDGLLARDLNNDGVINNGGELFGEFTLTESGERAYEGIEALTDLDENHDNRIDRNDSAWSSLTVWRDSNTNAITEEGELLSMAQAGISTISLDARSNYTDLGNGNIIYQETTAESDEGKSILIADVNYAVDYYNRIQDSSIKITPEIAQLPNARAFGAINDLREALVLNPDLKRSLDAFVDEKDASLRNKKLDDLLFHWAGVEQVGDGDPDKFNLQKKAFVQKLSCSTKVMVDNEYRRYKVYAKAQIDAQTRFAEIFRQFVKSPYSSAAPTIIIDFSAFGDFILTSHFARDFSSVSAYLETLFGLTVYSQTLQTQFDLEISSLKPLSRYALIFALTSTRPNDTNRGEYYRRDSGIAVLLEGASFHDTSLDDLFYGSSVNDNFTSSDGNDSLYGGDGNDILNHAVTADDNQQNIVYDNDYFEGGPGKDIYVFTPPGSLVINNNDDSNSKDKLLFEKSIKPSQVKLKKTQKQDLTILFKKHSNSQVTIKNYFLDNGRSAYRLEHIVFNNKTIWTPEDIIAYFTDKTPLPGVNVK